MYYIGSVALIRLFQKKVALIRLLGKVALIRPVWGKVLHLSVFAVFFFREIYYSYLALILPCVHDALKQARRGTK